MNSINTVNNSVRQGPYELQIVNGVGQPLPIMNFHGQLCARSQCGMTYNIKVIVHRDAAGVFPVTHLVICAKVDGRCVGYGKRLEVCSGRYRGQNQASCLFEGFRDSKEDICAFVFDPVEAVCSFENSAVGQKEAGSISVIIYAAIPTTEIYTPTPVKDPSLRLARDDDKKFWQSPSAVTVVGDKVCNINFAWNIWRRLDEPLATLQVYYHTPEMFDFIKDFQTRIPNPTGEPATSSNSSSTAVRRPLPPEQVLPGGSILVDLPAEEDAPTATAIPNISTIFATIPAITPTTTAAITRPRSPEWEVWMDLAVEGAATSHLSTTPSIRTTTSIGGSRGACVRTSDGATNPTTTTSTDAAVKTPDSKKRPYNNLFC